MPRPRPLRALAACALALAPLGLAACGPEGERGDEARKTLEKGQSALGLREGLTFPVDKVDYTVVVSRELNIRDPEDSQYYTGREPPPGFALFGVFVRACNAGEPEVARQSARTFTLVDTQEHRFQPLPVEEDNHFAYHPRRLAPKECIPEPSSAVAFGPTGAVVLVYQVPLDVFENRPLELEVEGTYDAMKGERQVAIVELDL